MKKKNLAKKYFIIISATFILGLIFAYGTRLVHFYLKENKNINRVLDIIIKYYEGWQPDCCWC